MIVNREERFRPKASHGFLSGTKLESSRGKVSILLFFFLKAASSFFLFFN